MVRNKLSFLFVLLLIPGSFIGQPQETKNQPETIQEVYENDFYRNTFYTWTTEAQISELRKNKTLLTKSKSETKGYSLFDMALQDSALKKNILAQLLRSEQFEKKRFAWTNAWATVMGWEGENYGYHLIKIVLDDSAIIGKYNEKDIYDPLDFFDSKGRRVFANDVIKNKDRIAVIYHVNYYKGDRKIYVPKRKGTYYVTSRKIETAKETIPFREFVIINEKMIKSWSYGTPDIKKELASEISLLKQFMLSKEANQKAFGKENEKEGWDDEKPGLQNEYSKYHASSCFENDYYLFNTKQLQAIIKQLEKALAQQSTPITK